MKLLKTMLKIVVAVINKRYYHTNVKLLAFHVAILLINESMNSQKFNEKKTNFINRLKYAELKIFCIRVEV